jgi:hypothetical protein
MWEEKAGKKNVSEVYYSCNPLMADNAAYKLADQKDKEFECQVGPISPKTGGKDMADWCTVKVKWLVGEPNKIEKREAKDGKVKDWEGRNGGDVWGGDKWKFENEGK